MASKYLFGNPVSPRSGINFVAVAVVVAVVVIPVEALNYASGD